MRARYYESQTGRFTSRDSFEGNINTPASLNRFNYAHSNPVMNTDPSGHFAQIIAAASLGALLGGVFAYPFAEYIYTSALAGKCGCEMQDWAQEVGHQWVGETVAHAMLIGAVAGVVASTGPAGMILVGSLGVTASAIDALRVAWQGFAQGGFDVCLAARFIGDVIGYTLSVGALSAGVNEIVPSTRPVQNGVEWYYNRAIQNRSSDSALLGKYIKSSDLSYEVIARKGGYMHLDAELSVYREFVALYGEEAWWNYINARFVYDVAAQGKPVYISTDPKVINPRGDLAKEINLLRDLGYSKPEVDPTTNLWKMTRK